MDNSCHSSGDSAGAGGGGAGGGSGSYRNNNSNQFLKQLNKQSLKICKPTTTANAAATAAAAVVAEVVKKPGVEPPQTQSNNEGNIHQHQPPVYNINKNDFRDVVQRLTGSPAHERISSSSQPTPAHHPKPQSSRLHRIRPPPLAHVGNRPPQILNNPNPNPNPNLSSGGPSGFVPRPSAPLSPLPPLPPVHAAAESPVSAYMRYLHNSVSATDSNPKQFSGFSPLAPLVSPRWYQTNPPPPLPPPQPSIPLPPAPQPPAPFGCLNSPRSQYALLSPSILFSPTSSQPGFPLSPTVQVPSPKFKGL